MEIFFSLLAICAGNSPITGWVNNRKAVDLWHYRAHYDVIVMIIITEIRSIFPTIQPQLNSPPTQDTEQGLRAVSLHFTSSPN